MVPDPSGSQVGKEGAEGGVRPQSKAFPWEPMAATSLLAGNITEELCLLMFRVNACARKHEPEAETSGGCWEAPQEESMRLGSRQRR